MNERLGFVPVAWPQTADALGFSAPDAPDAADAADAADAPDADGARALNGFTLRSEGDWLTLVDRRPVPDDPLSSGLGTPGLWRVVQAGATLARVHDLPQLRGVEEVCDAGGPPSLGAFTLFLEWAAATRDGRCPPGWRPPPRDEVERWLTPSRLKVRSGPILARGELVHEPGRLALVFAELAEVPETLSSARRSWLDGLLLDAQRRWRLARFGIDAETGRIQAEVDLTGMPALWARSLVQLSLEALAWTVEWVLVPLSFLVDTGATSRALDRLSFPSLNRSTST